MGNVYRPKFRGNPYFDTNRWTYRRLWGDTPGCLGKEQFGSAHPSGFHMAMCDGAAHRGSCTIDVEIHRSLGSRVSGTLIPGDALRKSEKATAVRRYSEAHDVVFG